MIQELQEILNKEGDLEIYEESDNNGFGTYFRVFPKIKVCHNNMISTYSYTLPDKFIILDL